MKTQKLFFSALMMICSISLFSQIIQVPADQPTIQGGIDYAVDGDTVLVAEGTYYENINFMGKAITVASHFILDGDANHISSTVIDGSQPANPNKASVVTMENGEDTTSVICGFTITGGAGTYLDSYQIWSGGGIYCYPAGAKIINNYIEYNEIYSTGYGYGGGIVGDNGSGWFVIRNNKIINNKIEANEAEGGAISLWSNAIVSGNEITNNMSISNAGQSMGGLYCRGDYYPDPITVCVQDNFIAYNAAFSNQNSGTVAVNGGLGIRECSGLVKGNRIISNFLVGGETGWAAGVMLDDCDTSLVFKENIVANNTFSECESSGGGICIFQGSATLVGNLVYGNQATYGGGLYLSQLTEPYPVFINNTICQNNAEEEGGGIFIDEGVPVFRNTILWDNSAGINGDEIMIEEGDIDIQYSDIKDGWPGSYNIDDDPLFENPDDFDFHLTEESPCIDAGDPNSPPDPDGTVCDMGRYFFHQGTLIEVPSHFATIQEGIEAATTGDTILVAQGTYIENINFNGKAITVMSNYLFTSDSADIYNTIIDGSQPANLDFASVVSFISGEDTTSVLCGFTIQNGTGTIEPGSDWRLGGGINCLFSSAKIIHNRIINNQVDHNFVARGGGVFVWGNNINTYFILKENLIDNNYLHNTDNFPGGSIGGGCNITGVTILIENNIVSNNTADGRPYGAGLCIVECNGIIKNNFITNNTGNSIIGSSRGAGLYIESHQAGLTITENSITGNRIFDISGTHNEGGGIAVMTLAGYENNEMFIDRNTIKNNLAESGGGIYLRDANNALITNNIIQFNDASIIGGGIYFASAGKSDKSEQSGVGILENSGKENNEKAKSLVPALVNNTITGNISENNGGGIGSDLTAIDFLAFNNIIYDNAATQGPEIYLQNSGSTAHLYNNDTDTNLIGGNGTWSGGNNIFVDPLFDEDGYHLLPESPCKDAGIDSIFISDQWYYCPCLDIDGDQRPMDALADIGVDEIDIYIGIEDVNHANTSLWLQNFPNPFNGFTTISFVLESDCYTDLSIYDLTGKKIWTLVSENKQAGIHEIEMDAGWLDNGVYFCVIKTNNGMQTKKMIKL